MNIDPFVKSMIFQIYFANVPKSRERIGEIEWGQKDHKGEYNMEHDKERKGSMGTKGKQKGHKGEYNTEHDKGRQGKQLYETLGRKYIVIYV